MIKFFVGKSPDISLYICNISAEIGQYITEFL